MTHSTTALPDFLAAPAAEGDAYCRTAAAVLCHPRFAHRRDVGDHVTRVEIDWDGILAAPWSGGERVMLQAAAHAWRGHGDVGLLRITALDDNFYGLFVSRLRLLRGAG